MMEICYDGIIGRHAKLSFNYFTIYSNFINDLFVKYLLVNIFEGNYFIEH